MIDKDIICGKIDTEKLSIDNRELSARLGYQADIDRIRSYVDAVLREADCRYSYIKVPLKIDGTECDFGFTKVDSSSLSAVLTGCSYAYIFAVTLGVNVDRLISRSYIVSKSDALVIDAVASATVEALADYVDDMICNDLNTTKRFSPGYADFPLEFQTALSDRINLLNNIGISLTRGLMMIPKKSVTAIIGIKNT